MCIFPRASVHAIKLFFGSKLQINKTCLFFFKGLKFAHARIVYLQSVVGLLKKESLSDDKNYSELLFYSNYCFQNNFITLTISFMVASFYLRCSSVLFIGRYYFCMWMLLLALPKVLICFTFSIFVFSWVSGRAPDGRLQHYMLKLKS